MLNRFATHSLDDQAGAALMDRIDTKYVLPIDALGEIVSTLIEDYTVLQTGDTRVFTYENTYFDTANWRHYLEHHNGKLNRRKYRYRRYRDTDSAFVELKQKTNTGRTLKHRAPCPGSEAASLIDLAQLLPRLYVNYQRLTFYASTTRERLTVDLDLRYCRPGSTTVATLPAYFVAEQKCISRATASEFTRLARKHSLTAVSFSKYCTGACLTDPANTLKKNRFAPLLRRLAVSRSELST